jgi:hypothetical protein
LRHDREDAARFGETARGRQEFLDARRLARVIEFVDANAHRDLTLPELVDVAALGAFHFASNFMVPTG